jgi:hypothetical protein
MKLLLIIAALVAVISVADPAAGSVDLEEKVTQVSYTEEDTVHGRQIIPTNQSIPSEKEAIQGYLDCVPTSCSNTCSNCPVGTYSQSGKRCSDCTPCRNGFNSPPGARTCCTSGSGLRLKGANDQDMYTHCTVRRV